MERIKILNTYIDNLSMAETVEEVDKFIVSNRPLHLMGVNADKINTLQDDAQLREIVNGCDIINADGASVIWASKVLKKPLKERVAGIDLMQELLVHAEQQGYGVYFLGAKENVVKKMVMIFKKRYPKLKISGYRNGYFKKEDWPQLLELINKSGAQIVFVGITSPLKEYLVEYFQEQGSTCVYMGVGGSFDVLSGNIPRAPLWMQKCSLEWLFRVMQEPRRLFKRYFVGNFRFIISVYKERFKKER